MERIRDRTRSQVLLAHQEGPQTNGSRSCQLGAPVRRRRPGPRRAGKGVGHALAPPPVAESRAEKNSIESFASTSSDKSPLTSRQVIAPEEARRRARLEFGGPRARQRRSPRHPLGNHSIIFSVISATPSASPQGPPASRSFAIFRVSSRYRASTIVFGVVYNVFFHALPYKTSAIVVINRQTFETAGPRRLRSWFSPAEIRAFREQNHVFEDMIAYTFSRPTYNDGKIRSLFSWRCRGDDQCNRILGVQRCWAARSRKKMADLPPPVFVMNYQLWQRQFGRPQNPRQHFYPERQANNTCRNYAQQFNPSRGDQRP